MRSMFKFLQISSLRNIEMVRSLVKLRPCTTQNQRNYFFVNYDPKLFSLSYLALNQTRQFKLWSAACSEESEVIEADENKKPKQPVDPSKDRTKIIPPEVSIRYIRSEAYKTTYGDEPVWVKYRRNFKGHYIPKKTRKTCIRGGVIATGNPCPICRDEYLVVHYTNVDLLKQFINPYTGEIYDMRKIHVCQRKLLELEVAIKKAKFFGLLMYDVPFRRYNYSEYYPQWKE